MSEAHNRSMRYSKGWIVFLTACTLFGAPKTQQLEFTADGLLTLKNSTGAVTIEAWDKPAVELTTESSNPDVTITPERHGNEMVITTVVPRKAPKNLTLSYHLRVPRDTRLVIDHRDGEVNVEGLASDIEASLRRGQIFIYLPDGVDYTTSAISKLGTINVPGDPTLTPKHFHLGHSLMQPSSTNSHALKLKVGFGDIYVMRQTPKPTK